MLYRYRSVFRCLEITKYSYSFYDLKDLKLKLSILIIKNFN